MAERGRPILPPLPKDEDRKGINWFPITVVTSNYLKAFGVVDLEQIERMGRNGNLMLVPGIGKKRYAELAACLGVAMGKDWPEWPSRR
jgi:hypothetical protein